MIADVELLRRAVEVAPRVLPKNMAAWVADGLLMAASTAEQGHRITPSRIEVAHEVLALAEQRPVDISSDIRAVLEYVSAGRKYIDIAPYPDALARRTLGALPAGDQ